VFESADKRLSFLRGKINKLNRGFAGAL